MTGKKKVFQLRSSLLSPLVALALLAPLAVTAGCGSSKLETGYTPRPLNASDAERRAYYSGKYTKEAVRADQEREADFRARRPGM
jgi:hypothetical protein